MRFQEFCPSHVSSNLNDEERFDNQVDFAVAPFLQSNGDLCQTLSLQAVIVTVVNLAALQSLFVNSYSFSYTI
jgi:hypothetical protein